MLTCQMTIFEEEVDNIEQLCHKYSSGINDVMLVGHLNIDLIRENAHSKHINQLAERYGLKFCRNHINADYSYTYEHPCAGHYSSIDQDYCVRQIHREKDNIMA